MARNNGTNSENGTSRGGVSRTGAVATATGGPSFGAEHGGFGAPGARAGRRPTAEEIRKRAYELYSERKGQPGTGTAEQDWLRAERELNARVSGR